MFEFLERQITHFLVPAYHLLQARLGANITINPQAFIAPLSILFEGYGVSTTALVCAIVEIIALVVLIFTHGLEGTVMDLTLPYLFSRLKIVFLFIYVTFASPASPLASKSTIYIQSAFIIRPALESQPGYSLLNIPRYVFTFLFGEDYYLTSTTSYLKNLHYRVSNYAIRQMEKKILHPSRRMLEKTKKDPILAFMFRVAFPLFAISVFWTSIVTAFFVACALDLATKVSAMPKKCPGLFIEGVVEAEDVDITMLSIFSTLSIMDATLCDVDDGVFKLITAAVVEEEVDEEAIAVVEDVVGPKDVFEDAIEGVVEEVVDVVDVVSKEEVQVEVKETVFEAVDEVEVSKEAVEAVKMEEETVVEKEAVVSAVEESGAAVMDGKVGEKVSVLGDLNGAKPPSVSHALEKKAGCETVCAVGQTTRLTPLAAPFVPRFVRKSIPIPATATAPTRSTPAIPPPIPINQSTPAHWAPARTVSVVLEAPRRRGGRACKATEGADGTTAGKSLSRKERHKKLMGLAAKNRP
ncbi:hypothetical protein CPC08DRAFT_750143 [Agrocybe pediades]|nr:hypothetical protein CPC08DRAFT_750143 [Agrocybe pediades]